MNQTTLSVLSIILVLAGAMSVAAGPIWLERRLLALWQDRYGPNRVGPFGLLQVLADRCEQPKHRAALLPGHVFVGRV